MNIYKQLMAGVLFAIALPVFAHSDQLSTVPADGAVVAEPVKMLQFTFPEAVRLLKVEMMKVDGEEVELDFTPSIGPGTEFKVDVPTLEAGDYRVDWVLMGEDGHKMNGHFGFTHE